MKHVFAWFLTQSWLTKFWSCKKTHLSTKNYHGKLEWCVWPDFPEINLTWEIIIDTSKRRKESLMTFDVVNSLSLSMPQAWNQSGFFIGHQHETAINFVYFSWFLACCFRKDRCWHGRFSMKLTGKFFKVLTHDFSWFLGPDVGKVFTKNVF